MQFTLSTITAFAALASTAFASPISARSSASYAITVKNSCAYTIWPGAGQSSDSTSSISTAASGFELTSGSSETITAPASWLAGRVFARTGCTGSGSSFHCSVGDCGAYSCLDNTGVEDVTLAEFSYSDMALTFYDISLISGYNVGMKITPTDSACETYDCASESCSDSEAYRADSSSNPTMGCSLSSGYTIEFCPS